MPTGNTNPQTDQVPVRKLRKRRESTPVPAELYDAADPLALAFHVSACMSEGDEVSIDALSRYWGGSRRSTRAAKNILMARGLWIEVDVSRKFGEGRLVEMRAVESRVTDRDLIELALEYPAKTRLKTAGLTWQITEVGTLVTVDGHEGRTLTTGIGHEGQSYPQSAGQPYATSSGHEGNPYATSSGHVGSVCAGQPYATSGGHEGSSLIKEGTSFPKGTNEVPSFVNGSADATLRGARAVASFEDEELLADLRQRAAQLPWDVQVGRTPENLNRIETELVPAMFKAVRKYQRTPEWCQNYALSKMPDATSVGFLVKAFGEKLLPLKAPDDVLPMPGQGSAKAGKKARPSVTKTAAGEALTEAAQGSEPIEILDVNAYADEFGDAAIVEAAKEHVFVVGDEHERTRLWFIAPKATIRVQSFALGA